MSDRPAPPSCSWRTARPRTRDEILPYYTDIRRGRPPTDEQLADLVARYEAIGGTSSPLAAAHRGPARRTAGGARRSGARRSTTWCLGLKHADADDRGGRRRDRGRASAASSGWCSHRTSRLLDRPVHRPGPAAAEPHGIGVAGIDSWAVEPAFVEFLAADSPPGSRDAATPRCCSPRTRCRSASSTAGTRTPPSCGRPPRPSPRRSGCAEWSQWAIAWQSAGRTPEPWLGPDILQVIDELGRQRARRRRGVVVCACGFVADHLEVLYDLDIEAAARAASHGLGFDRTACVNDDPAVMAALAAAGDRRPLRIRADRRRDAPGRRGRRRHRRPRPRPRVLAGARRARRSRHGVRGAGPPGRQDPHVALRRARPRRRGTRRVPRPCARGRPRSPAGSGSATSSVARPGSAAVWWHGLHRIPQGLLLGVPTDVMELARIEAASAGRARSAPATEVLPRTDARRRLDRRVRPGPVRRRGARTSRRSARRQHLRRGHRPVQPRRGPADRRSRRQAPQRADRPAGSAARPPPQRRAGVLRTGGWPRRAGRPRGAVRQHGGAVRPHRRAGGTTLEADGAGWRRRRRARSTPSCSPARRAAARLLRDAAPEAAPACAASTRRRRDGHRGGPRRRWPERLHGAQRLSGAQARCSTWSRRPRSGRRSGPTGGRRRRA